MNLLKDVRKLKGFTQAQLAEEVGCSQATIHAVEAGKKRLSTYLADRISDVLGVESLIFCDPQFPDLMQLFKGQDVDDLMATDAGKQFLIWVVRSRLEANDLWFASAIVVLANYENRFLDSLPRQFVDEMNAKAAHNQRRELSREAGRLKGRCARWNIAKGKPCTCGQHSKEAV